MKQISLSQGKFALVDDEDYDFLMQWKWCISATGYAVRRYYVDKINGKYVYKHVIMHRLILKTPDKMQTDHINMNRLDNRKINLRICGASENQGNKAVSKMKKDKISKYKGVFLQNGGKTWTANITKNRKRYHLGTFKNQEDAALAYNFAAMEHFGEFARINT